MKGFDYQAWLDPLNAAVLYLLVAYLVLYVVKRILRLGAP